MLKKIIKFYKRSSLGVKITIVVVCFLPFVFIPPMLKPDPRKEQNEIKPIASQDYKVLVKRSVATDVNKEQVYYGLIEPDNITDIASEVNSVVKRILVEEGSYVKKGQKILEFDRRDALAKYKSASQALKNAKINYNSEKTLFNQKLSSESDLLGSKSAYENAKSSYELARINLNNHTITAPFDSMIESVSVKQGETVFAGNPVARFISNDVLFAIFDIPENMIKDVKLNQKTDIIVSGKSFEGKIAFISAVANEKTKTFKVKALILGDEVPESGRTARVSVVTDVIKAHRIPPSALSVGSNNQEIVVKTIDQNAIVKSHTTQIVKQERSGDFFIQGLMQQADIIILGQDYVKDGQKVQYELR